MSSKQQIILPNLFGRDSITELQRFFDSRSEDEDSQPSVKQAETPVKQVEEVVPNAPRKTTKRRKPIQVTPPSASEVDENPEPPAPRPTKKRCPITYWACRDQEKQLYTGAIFSLHDLKNLTHRGVVDPHDYEQVSLPTGIRSLKEYNDSILRVRLANFEEMRKMLDVHLNL